MSTDKLMDFRKILDNFDNSLQSENIKANFNNCICIYNRKKYYFFKIIIIIIQIIIIILIINLNMSTKLSFLSIYKTNLKLNSF